jgi:hypothetical protein
MKKLILPVLVSFFAISAANATEHHSGHGGGAAGSGGSSTQCTKPHVSKFLPAHLATVVPGSDFSFVAFNIYKPEQVEVTVKKAPVEVTSEFKDPFYIFRGKLPAELRNTAARIDVKVRSKNPHCETENGWLVKIAE